MYLFVLAGTLPRTVRANGGTTVPPWGTEIPPAGRLGRFGPLLAEDSDQLVLSRTIAKVPPPPPSEG